MNTPIGDKLFQDIPRRVAKFRENRPRDVEKSVDGKRETMAAFRSIADADIIFCSCGYFLLSLFVFSSPNLSGRRLFLPL